MLAAHTQDGEAPEGLDESVGHQSIASQDVLPRAAAVATLASEPFDVLVIGGGITGAGVALDAATRGYSVALVERADFASGTSSRSSKLVHGGLRYLQNFDLGLVREALLERQINVNLAPHLVRPLRLVVPAFDGRAAGPARRPRPERLRRDGRRPAATLAARAQARAGGTRLEPRAPPGHLRARGQRAAARARATAQPTERLPLLRLPDRRRPARADRAGRGRALRRGVREPARGRRAARGRRPRDRRAPARRRERRGARGPRHQRRQRDRRLGRPVCALPSCTTRPRCR